MDEGYVQPTSSILLDNSPVLDDIKQHAKSNKLILADKVYELNDLDKDFKEISYLGKGTYGEVTEYEHIKSNAHIAMKRVSLKIGRNAQADSKKLTAKVLREIRIHEELNSCPHIIEFYGFFIDKNKQNLYIIMELMDLTMKEFYSTIHGYDRFPEELICHLTVPLIEGLLHAKGKDILHRDIKPSNILLNHKGEVKLSDFGEATQAVQGLVSTCCGTANYFPPERWDIKNVEYDDRSDVWSLGITLAEALANGKHYIDELGNVPTNIAQIMHLTTNTTPEEILSRCSFSSDDCPMREFLRDCIQELNTRPHIHDLQNSSLYKFYTEEREEGIRILSESVREILNECDETNLEMEETNDSDETNSENETNSETSLSTGSNLNEPQNQPSTSNHTSSQLNEETVNHAGKKISLTKFAVTVFFMMVLSNELNDIHPKASKPKNENSTKSQETSSGHTKKIRTLPKSSIRNKKADDIGRKRSSSKSVVVGIENPTFLMSFKGLKEYDLSNESSFQQLREIKFKNGCVFHIPKYFDVSDLLNGFIGSGTRSIAM